MSEMIDRMMLKPSIPALTDEGLLAIADYIINKKYLGLLEGGPSRRLQLSGFKPFTKEEPLDAEYQRRVEQELFVTTIRKMKDSIERYEDFCDRMSAKNNENNEYKKYTKQDFLHIISLVEAGKIEDAINTPLGNIIFIGCADLIQDHVGKIGNLPYILDRHGSERTLVRIYINTSNGKNGFDFLNLYANKCIEAGIPYNMKGQNNNEQDRTDGTVLYIPNQDIEKVLAILEEIKAERPDIIKYFGSPVASAHNESYYAVCQEPQSGSYTYNLYFDNIAYLTFMKTFSSLILQKFSTKLNDSQLSELIKLASDEFGFSNNNSEVDKWIDDASIIGWCDRFLDSYIDLIKTIFRNNPNAVIRAMREKLQLCTSLSLYKDKEHTTRSVAFAKEMYDYFGIASIEEVKVGEKQKKTITFAQFKQIATTDLEQHPVLAMSVLGCPLAKLRGKTSEQIRNIVFDHVRLDDEELIGRLCGGEYRLKEALMYYGLDPKAFEGKSKDDLRAMLIEKVGIDNVTEASINVKHKETDDKKLDHSAYESTLETLRQKRAKMIAATFNLLPTSKEIFDFWNQCTSTERLDAKKFINPKALSQIREEQYKKTSGVTV